MWKKQCRAGHAPYCLLAIWRMRIAGWIPKATNTHSQHVILTAFPLQQWFQESASLLRNTYVACLVQYFSHCPTLRIVSYKHWHCKTVYKQIYIVFVRILIIGSFHQLTEYLSVGFPAGLYSMELIWYLGSSLSAWLVCLFFGYLVYLFFFHATAQIEPRPPD